MANKKRKGRKTAASGQKNIQITALVILVLVVAGLIWVITGRKPQETQIGSVPTPKTLQYSSAPPMTIDPSKQYFATVKMAKGGSFIIQLYPDKAPITVNNSYSCPGRVL
jgi:hypothetical protein